MANPKLLVLKGLQASGKSTYALSLVNEQGFVRTNKDTIREELFGEAYKRKDEKKVIKERNRQITEALEAGKDVVVDDTNLNPVHIKDLLAIARKYNATFEVNDSFLDVPLGECIERDKLRDKSVGEQVIRETFHRWIGKPRNAIRYDPNLPTCVISDIDGTLAHMKGKRKPFDWDKVGLDTVDEGVAHLLDAVNYMGYAKVFLFSGRSDICRPETEEWLERHDIEYEALYMKPHARVQEDDRICKREFLLEHIVGKYNILWITDDRPKVCRMWRDEFGINVFQLGDPYYEF